MTAARSWRWVSLELAKAAHREQIRLHGGGGDAIRDVTLLESAMARARNLAAYGSPDAAELAAAYAYGIARNHPFVDGNKRTALVVSITFLRLNGERFTATEAQATVAFLALAAGELSEKELTLWFRNHMQ